MSGMVGAPCIFFPHVDNVEAVVSLNTLKIKSQKGKSLWNDFPLISLPNIKTHRCLFIIYIVLFHI